jgi:5-methylcytosine-specific restriction endonuclease McrA
MHLREIERLDDGSLLSSLKRHVGSSNRITALVLAHLAEVDSRGAYRQWACETLAAYCVYELRLSEDEAQRRCRAARAARQFPVLFEMLADASIHLTGIVLLAPYLTAENHREVLARARYRRKREIELLVAELAPARDVPALIEPLAARARVPRSDWAAVAESGAGWVRELLPGDGPTLAPSAPNTWHAELLAKIEADGAPNASDRGAAMDATAPARHEVQPHEPTARLAACASHEPGRDVRYRIQYTADRAYVDLLEQARALLWHRLPNGDLAQLQRLALEALLEKLVGRKYGAGARSATVEQARSSATNSGIDETPAGEASAADATANASAGGLEIISTSLDAEATTSARVAAEPPAAPPDSAPALPSGSLSPCSQARTGRDDEHMVSHASRSRHVPASVRGSVWLRDAARCTFVDARGVRCRATTALELHHEHPFARGGPSTVENLRLRCHAHNALAAEQDFGRDVILARKQSATAPRTPTS